LLRFGLALSLLLSGLSARADEAAEARSHYEKGTAHYALGEFAQAAEEYQAAFRLRQDSALLFNAAQAYRLAGNVDKALVLYRNYVLLFPGEANVDIAREQIARLKQAPASTQTKPEAASAPKSLPPPNDVKLKHEEQTTLARHDSPPARKSKRVVLGVVIGSLAAVGIAVGLGVGLGDRPRDPVATIGAWRLK
jgi:tetratricopeptide (TPR) repeat protein